jgi:hypothetical protein
MPVDWAVLQSEFAEGRYLLTEHASERAAWRGILSRELEEVVANGEVIEDYPDDKYGLSCLILGRTTFGRILHIQVSYPPSAKVITVHEPDPDRWDDNFRVRQRHE